jgi:hypothetical protein
VARLMLTTGACPAIPVKVLADCKKLNTDDEIFCGIPGKTEKAFHNKENVPFFSVVSGQRRDFHGFQS